MPFPNKTFALNNDKAISAGKKGGKVVTDKQRLAQKIAAWKRYGVNPKVANKVMMLYENRDFTAADWFKHIDTLEEFAKVEPKMIPTLVNMKKDWARFAHGDKLTTENVHHIMNWTDKLKDAEIRPEETD
jgi:hypothetical protein